MKKIYFFLLAMGLAASGFAQQWPQYSLYSWNPISFNPAYAGMDGSLSFTGVFRKQWVGLEGSPSSQHANVHLPVGLLNSGFGLYLSNDQLGAERLTGVGFAYNYRIPVGREGVLGLGVNGQWSQYTLDGAKLRTPGGSYEGGALDHNDGLLPLGRFNATGSGLGAGIFFNHPKAQAGVSVQNLLEGAFSLQDELYITDRTFFGYLAGRIDLGRRIQWMPSVLAKSNALQTQVDWTNIIGYDGNFYGGFSFRGYDQFSIDAAVILAGIRINEKLFLGYAYDIPLSYLNRVNEGSHEIMLQYNLQKAIGKARIPPIIYSPRF